MLATTRTTSRNQFTSSSVAETMQRLCTELSMDYAGGRHCEAVAWEVAFALIAVGKSPEIVCFRPVEGTKLHPMQFDGKVEWEVHSVVVCDDLVYDPLLGVPVPQNQYGILEFSKEVTPISEFRRGSDLIKRVFENRLK